MKTALENAATWVLDTSRPDLIENWFKLMRDHVNRMRKQVYELTYGGIEGDVMPAHILSEVEKLRSQATYMHFLASSALEQQQSEWDAETKGRVTRTAELSIDAMADDVNAIAKAHRLLGGVYGMVVKYANGSVSA